MRLIDPEADQDEGLMLTPLIDVVFLLLIFFLTTTTFSRDEVEMDLELPEAAHGVAGEPSHTIVINVMRSGSLIVDGRVVTVEALKQKLNAAASRNKEQEILIRGDTQARFGLVAQVLDACLGASLTAISIGANPDEAAATISTSEGTPAKTGK
ncbi:MAG: ExbD/TolR family protein [Planctomycetota bacterium]